MREVTNNAEAEPGSTCLAIARSLAAFERKQQALAVFTPDTRPGVEDPQDQVAIYTPQINRAAKYLASSNLG